MVTADHGPAVSGAHNTIVCARAGKDLVSCLASGLLTIVSQTSCIKATLSLESYYIWIGKHVFNQVKEMNYLVHIMQEVLYNKFIMNLKLRENETLL